MTITPVPPHLSVPAAWRRPYRRTLTAPVTGKRWSISVDGSTTSHTGAPGRERLSERGHASPDAALVFAGNEALKRLRQGMILRTPDAETGEPLLQISVGRGYTGALPVAATHGTVYSTDGTGTLIAVDPVSGVLDEVWNPPGNQLIWQIACPAPAGDGAAQVVARTDDLIQFPGAGDRQIRDGRLADSAMAGGLLLVASHGTRSLTVRQASDGVTLERIPVEQELYGGHTPMLCAALSADASMLAWCDAQSSVQVRRIGGGTVRSVPIPPGLVERVQLSGDGSMLFATIAADGGMRIVARDTHTAAQPPGWDDIQGSRLDLAVGDDQVAVLADSVVTVRDCDGGTRTAFALDHVVHRTGIAWRGGDLAVRTDSGCVCLYAVRR